MPDLKLAKLPDRTPVKINVVVSPELNASLHDYADLYQKIYGQSEPVNELIPYILQSFLDSDRGFAKTLKQKNAESSRNGAKGTNHKSAL